MKDESNPLIPTLKNLSESLCFVFYFNFTQKELQLKNSSHEKYD